MGKFVFSSWGNNVVDNRGREPGEYIDAPNVALPEQDNHGKKIVGVMGWDGIIVVDPQARVVAMARDYLRAVVEDLCGRCTSCRQGNKLLMTALEKIAAGQGTIDDLEAIEHLLKVIKNTTMCSLGQTPMAPIADSLTYFRSEYLELIEKQQAVAQLQNKTTLTAPCQNACPIHLDIPGYVELIKGERYADSLALIRERAALPGTLGRVCVQFCEKACRRATLDEPICIKTLKRHVADFELANNTRPAATPSDQDKPKVAIVGAGPAGLAAAYYLGLRGYPVTVFEALPVAGGMAAVGIPAYRLPRDVLEREVDIIKATGVEIRYNARLGQDITLQSLREQGYKATFMAIGCHGSGLMGVEGEDANYEGFIPGVVFLRDLNLGNPVKPQKSVAIVGGGNVAMDCARSALRLGFSDVNLIYRRTRAEMPANAEEVEDAEKEGIKFHFLTNPTKIMAENGKVSGLELQRMELGEPDSSGRRRPVPVVGSEFVMKVDVVIPAIGQVTDLACLCATDAVVPTRRGYLEVNPSTLATADEGVFAGGDCVTGPATLVEALAAGNRAAVVIDHYLRGEALAHSDDEDIEEIFAKLGVYSLSEDSETAGRRAPSFVPRQPVERMDPDTDMTKPNSRRRPHQTARPVEVRIWDFDEVELGFEPETAVSDAERCLRCYRVGLVSTTD